MARFISLLFDVEDPVNLVSDDAALRVADVVSSLGVRGTFCITGDKCRRLLERGRQDVIDAFLPHALGFHTAHHSLHPTTMELLEDKGWADGVQAIVEQEKEGLEWFRKAFDREPCCWGGAGNTWGAQVCGAMAQLKVPALVYSQTAVAGGFPHRYAGCLMFPSFAYLGEDNMERDDTADAATAAAIEKAKASPSPWAEVFCGHPTRYRHMGFWDGPYSAGKTPDVYNGPMERPAADFERCMVNLGLAIARLRDNFEVLGLDDVLKLPWLYRELSNAEMDDAYTALEQHVRGSAGWPINKPDLNTDRIVSEALGQLHTLRVAYLAE